MRAALWSTFAWFGALQFLNGPTGSLDTAARLAAIASVLGALTVLVYRLGVWTQRVEAAQDRVAEEVRTLREETAARSDRIERQLEANAHLLAMLVDQVRQSNRRQTLMDRRLARLEDDPSPYRDVLA